MTRSRCSLRNRQVKQEPSAEVPLPRRHEQRQERERRERRLAANAFVIYGLCAGLLLFHVVQLAAADDDSDRLGKNETCSIQTHCHA